MLVDQFIARLPPPQFALAMYPLVSLEMPRTTFPQAFSPSTCPGVEVAVLRDRILQPSR